MIVVTGALVRLTGSGLGCDSWPGCEEGRFFPAESYHGFIEFGNRVFGAIPITLTFLTWLASRGHGRFVHRTALAAFLLTLLQAPVGLIVIATDLEPVAVVVHFVLALLALAAALVVVLETRVTEPERTTVPEELRLAGYVLLVSCLGLVVTGTFTTAAGPHAGDPDVDRLWMLESAIRVHVVSAGAFGLTLLFVLGYLAARRESFPRLFRAGLVLSGLALAQAVVGELQWQTELPWGVVLVHVALAAAVWAGTVVVVGLFHRPLRAVPEASA